ncbi:hypothetical protein ASPTUDRAFT_273203 [Aspergillus tubingensis CBS 134.48]|uniref:Uncharacterized protein n=1 Tax=Aspergillus tubingensis (strain CBS 134.48) TaxID=767770 RepID=A0A1L9NNK4_ASPTC|nr:hypothetical protein ASPTUDRAFT_273203 [Aspergillus tubingensis CBS 134.48]
MQERGEERKIGEIVRPPARGKALYPRCVYPGVMYPRQRLCGLWDGCGPMLFECCAFPVSFNPRMTPERQKRRGMVLFNLYPSLLTSSHLCLLYGFELVESWLWLMPREFVLV